MSLKGVFFSDILRVWMAKKWPKWPQRRGQRGTYRWFSHTCCDWALQDWALHRAAPPLRGIFRLILHRAVIHRHNCFEGRSVSSSKASLLMRYCVWFRPPLAARRHLQSQNEHLPQFLSALVYFFKALNLSSGRKKPTCRNQFSALRTGGGGLVLASRASNRNS